MAWTDEDKQKAIDMYEKRNPTPENSTELVKEIAEELEQSPNGVRMILMQAGVYLKKEAGASTTSKTGTTKTGEGTKRVSKDAQLDELRKAITARGASVDEDILSKLTGKAAAYFAQVLTT